jgi:hypothetical protein
MGLQSAAMLFLQREGRQHQHINRAKYHQTCDEMDKMRPRLVFSSLSISAHLTVIHDASPILTVLERLTM